ncbi:unnamed protein product, partial [Iphiclides podalirius]
MTIIKYKDGGRRPREANFAVAPPGGVLACTCANASIDAAICPGSGNDLLQWMSKEMIVGPIFEILLSYRTITIIKYKDGGRGPREANNAVSPPGGVLACTCAIASIDAAICPGSVGTKTKSTLVSKVQTKRRLKTERGQSRGGCTNSEAEACYSRARAYDLPSRAPSIPQKQKSSVCA